MHVTILKFLRTIAQGIEFVFSAVAGSALLPVL